MRRVLVVAAVVALVVVVVAAIGLVGGRSNGGGGLPPALADPGGAVDALFDDLARASAAPPSRGLLPADRRQKP